MRKWTSEILLLHLFVSTMLLSSCCRTPRLDVQAGDDSLSLKATAILIVKFKDICQQDWLDVDYLGPFGKHAWGKPVGYHGNENFWLVRWFSLREEKNPDPKDRVLPLYGFPMIQVDDVMEHSIFWFRLGHGRQFDKSERNVIPLQMGPYKFTVKVTGIVEGNNIDIDTVHPVLRTSIRHLFKRVEKPGSMDKELGLQ